MKNIYMGTKFYVVLSRSTSVTVPQRMKSGLQEADGFAQRHTSIYGGAGAETRVPSSMSDAVSVPSVLRAPETESTLQLHSPQAGLPTWHLGVP